MKKLIIAMAILLCLPTLCFAKVYLLVNNKDEIVSMSGEDDAVMEEGQRKIILSLDLQDIFLEYPPSYYKYVNKRFVVNVAKMADEDDIKNKKKASINERELIYKRAMKDACEALEDEGIKFTKLKCTDF